MPTEQEANSKSPFETCFGHVTFRGPNIIKPTIGRVVLYHHTDFVQPLPALVCYVHSDTLINVAVSSPDGRPLSSVSSLYPLTEVRLVQPGESPAPSNPYCTWPDSVVRGSVNPLSQADKDAIAKANISGYLRSVSETQKG